MFQLIAGVRYSVGTIVNFSGGNNVKNPAAGPGIDRTRVSHLPCDCSTTELPPDRIDP